MVLGWAVSAGCSCATAIPTGTSISRNRTASLLVIRGPHFFPADFERTLSASTGRAILVHGHLQRTVQPHLEHLAFVELQATVGQQSGPQARAAAHARANSRSVASTCHHAAQRAHAGPDGRAFDHS